MGRANFLYYVQDRVTGPVLKKFEVRWDKRDDSRFWTGQSRVMSHHVDEVGRVVFETAAEARVAWHTAQLEVAKMRRADADRIEREADRLVVNNLIPEEEVPLG